MKLVWGNIYDKFRVQLAGALQIPKHNRNEVIAEINI